MTQRQVSALQGPVLLSPRCPTLTLTISVLAPAVMAEHAYVPRVQLQSLDTGLYEKHGVHSQPTGHILLLLPPPGGSTIMDSITRSP